MGAQDAVARIAEKVKKEEALRPLRRFAFWEVIPDSKCGNPAYRT